MDVALDIDPDLRKLEKDPINTKEQPNYTKTTDRTIGFIDLKDQDNTTDTDDTYDYDLLENQNDLLIKQVNYLLNIINTNNIQIDPTYSKLPDNNINNWTHTNQQLLDTWISKITRTSFIYELILQKYQVKLNKYLMYSLILNAISALISVISTSVAGTDSTKYIWVIFGLNLGVSIITCLSTIINGYININNWSDIVKNLSAYVQQLDSFISDLLTQSMLPINMRTDGSDFIIKENQIFSNLLKASPNISALDFVEADKNYNDILSGKKPQINTKHIIQNN
jgi:hypothetical protein